MTRRTDQNARQRSVLSHTVRSCSAAARSAIRERKLSRTSRHMRVTALSRRHRPPRDQETTAVGSDLHRTGRGALNDAPPGALDFGDFEAGRLQQVERFAEQVIALEPHEDRIEEPLNEPHRP